jgi:hypothetical protein
MDIPSKLVCCWWFPKSPSLLVYWCKLLCLLASLHLSLLTRFLSAVCRIQFSWHECWQLIPISGGLGECWSLSFRTNLCLCCHLVWLSWLVLLLTTIVCWLLVWYLPAFLWKQQHFRWYNSSRECGIRLIIHSQQCQQDSCATPTWYPNL